MLPSLPSQDPRPESRASQLAESRGTWRYAYDWPVGVATSAELPKSANYGLTYVARSLEAYLGIVANLGAMTVSDVESGALERMVRERFETTDPGKLHDHLFRTPRDLAAAMGERRPTSWAEFEQLYHVWKAPPVVATFRQDARGQDLAFAWQRIAGVNPMTLARAASVPGNFPVTDEVFGRAMAGDRLEAALAEGRVFLADYAALDGIATGTTDGVAKYTGAPLALFAIERGTWDLLPVAIQCGQDPSRFPLFTPADGWRWWMARTAVQIADASVHEGVAHLGRTHMVMEAVNLAVNRQLSNRHPLSCLLLPHVETTAAINHSAKTSLIAPGGTVDRCFAPTIEAFGGVVKAALDSYRLDATAPPDDLRARGLDDRDVLRTHPYRDDALPVWDALRAYVGEYVALYYTSDADVAQDAELQAFVAELSADDGGRLRGVPPARTCAELAFLLTRLVWIGGPQHSAVNFPQFPYMGFPTNMPGASYRPMPDAETADEEASLVAMLPSWRIAIEDTTMVYLLSNVRPSRLGHYDLLHFRDPRVGPVVDRFQRKLAEIETATLDRDAGRLLPYPHLVPSQILQSVAI